MVKKKKKKKKIIKNFKNLKKKKKKKKKYLLTILKPLEEDANGCSISIDEFRKKFYIQCSKAIKNHQSGK